jgi:23S rRNA (uracil1939-C5)-methyltransferase
MEEPFYYRNKAQFPVGRNKEGKVVIGFYAGGTHSIIDTSHCVIQAKENEAIIEKIRTFLEEYQISTYDEENHKGLVRHILTRAGFVTGEIMVCLIINGDDLPHKEKLIESLIGIPGMTSISLNSNKAKTNVILGDKVVTLWGQPFITDYIGEIKYQISPLSFYQVNPKQTKVLYETALDYAGLHGDEVVWDLYCGIGTISLFLAGKARQVYGVEIIPQAIDDARQNAKINNIENAEFFVGAAEEVLPAKYKEDNIYAEVIVVDPPRKGCEESLLNTIVEMAPKRVVYVSCDPATLARDLRYLCDRGYQVEKVQAVDQFAHTVHVEAVCLLEMKGC